MARWLARLWAGAAGGWLLAVCALLARGADSPPLAALGSAAWLAVGAALVAVHAGHLRRLGAGTGGPRHKAWPALAPCVAAIPPLVGATWQAARRDEPGWTLLAGLLAAAMVATGVVVGRALERDDPRLLRRALLVAGLPATAVALAAPLRLLLQGIRPELVWQNQIAFVFAAIPGAWCAVAWLASARAASAAARRPVTAS